MKDLTAVSLERAKSLGASYSDIRIIQIKTEDITVRNGVIGGIRQEESFGFGVRVICDGCWGFAASSRVTKEEIAEITAKACNMAKANAILKKADVRLSEEEAHVATWQNPIVLDPFKVSLTDKLNLLYNIDKALRKDKRIKVAESSMDFLKERQWLATSEGTFIDQTIIRSGAGYAATAVKEGEVQRRSYPNSHGGQSMTMGYELVLGLPLLEKTEQVSEEAIALLSAKPCPSGKKDLILDGSQIALQIHESCGHPSELDRVFGLEESFAGSSFMTLEKPGNFRYGSDIVNLVADSTIPGGLATIGFDDDGVRAQRWHIVKDGILIGYHTNREFAPGIGEKSKGCCRADGWGSLPMIRITNLSLMPGEWDPDDLIADTKDGIFMATNKSWSIDQKRFNFQFATEIGWEIKKGKLGRMLKNCTYQGITPEFWGSCDAICSKDYWTLWGLTNCGKGQPVQTAEMSHGAAPARFRGVVVGVAR